MKKVMKSFMAMALGLSLVLAGCSSDDDKDADVNFAGTYEAVATVTGPELLVPDGPLTIPSITLTLTKEDANYRADAQLPQFGSLSLLLTSVTEVLNEGGLVGYTFAVENQTLTITGMPAPLPVSGNGTLGALTLSSITAYTIDMDLTVTGTGITVTIEGTK
jgi:hypothetical protein